MKKLALDVGSKKIGVAVSDSLNLIAQPLMVIRRSSFKQEAEEIRELVAEHEVNQIVVGLPINMDGSFGPQAKMATDYAAKLEEALKIDVVKFDERRTTVEAEKVLIEARVTRKKRKEVIDKLAAVKILQTFLMLESKKY